MPFFLTAISGMTYVISDPLPEIMWFDWTLLAKCTSIVTHFIVPIATMAVYTFVWTQIPKFRRQASTVARRHEVDATRILFHYTSLSTIFLIISLILAMTVSCQVLFILPKTAISIGCIGRPVVLAVCSRHFRRLMFPFCYSARSGSPGPRGIRNRFQTNHRVSPGDNLISSLAKVNLSANAKETSSVSKIFQVEMKVCDETLSISNRKITDISKKSSTFSFSGTFKISRSSVHADLEGKKPSPGNESVRIAINSSETNSFMTNVHANNMADKTRSKSCTELSTTQIFFQASQRHSFIYNGERMKDNPVDPRLPAAETTPFEPPPPVKCWYSSSNSSNSTSTTSSSMSESANSSRIRRKAPPPLNLSSYPVRETVEVLSPVKLRHENDVQPFVGARSFSNTSSSYLSRNVSTATTLTDITTPKLPGTALHLASPPSVPKDTGIIIPMTRRITILLSDSTNSPREIED